MYDDTSTEAKAAFLWIFGPALVLTFIHLAHSGRAFRMRRVKFPWAFWFCAAGALGEAVWAGGRLADILFFSEGPPTLWDRIAVPKPGENDWRVYFGGFVFNAVLAGAVLASPLRHLRARYRPAILVATLRATGGGLPREVMDALGDCLLAAGFVLTDPKPWRCEFAAVAHRRFPLVGNTPMMVFASFDSRGMVPVLRITVDVMDLVVEEYGASEWVERIARQIKTRLDRSDLAPHVVRLSMGKAEKPVL